MGRKKVSYGYHFLIWDAAAHKLIIKPKRANASTTPTFGLGDAIIKFNASNPPKKIVSPITGESKGKGLLPTSPFGLRRWNIAVSGVEEHTEKLEGSNNFKKDIHYPVASNIKATQLAKDVDIVKNGFGQYRVSRSGHRIEW